eukprot:PhM_4_TR11657/c0_g2_i3/m.16453
MNSNISTIEHYRKLFQFGFHVTASRALLLLHFSKIYPIHSICHDGCIYHLCSMDTEVVLSFCIDATHILLVDITQPLDNVPSYRTTSINRSQAVCLAVDDHPCVGITKWIEERPSLSFEFITFCAPISYDRAFDWIKDWENVRVVERGVYIDFHDSTNSCHRHCNYAFGDNIKLPIFELALPSSTTSNFTTTSLPDSFLKGCAHLTSVKLSSLTVNNNNNNVITSIGDGFLSGCRSLTYVDLSPLSDIRQIPSEFLRNCSSLVSVDLSVLRNVDSAGHSFLAGCASLTSVDLTPLHNVTSIGDFFLYRCSSLTSIDLSPLRNVDFSHASFLYGYAPFLSGCASIVYVDLSPLRGIQMIPSQFLRNCFSLTHRLT